MHTVRDPVSFVEIMADVLRLPDEAIAMSYIYLNRYMRFDKTSASADPLDPRLREILFPAHHLLHQHAEAVPSDPVAQPLTVPSEIYDILRATVVQAELMLLRVLGFELRIPLPLEYLPRYLERATEHLTDAGEDYERWGKEEKEEYGIVNNVMSTGLGRACRVKAVNACKDYQLANLFPARAVALGCLYSVMEERGWQITGGRSEWVANISSRKVDAEDFEEVLETIRSI